jgi:glycosyltransferase involved in cell wall biosynthesis
MKRILHVLGTLDRGGTESMLMNYYRHINRDEMQFDFVVHTTKHCDYEDEVLSLGGIVYRVPRFSLINLRKYKRSWNQLFSRHPEYQIIHVHHFLIAGIVMPIAARYGIPVRIVHSHNTKPPIFILKEKVMWLFHHDMIKYSTERLACSSDAGTYLFGNLPFKVFYNAIETDRYKYNESNRIKIRDEFGLIEDDFVIGHIGSFRTRQKNHSFLIDVFVELAKYDAHAKLLLIGDGLLKKEIEDKCRLLALEGKVFFAGIRDDVPAMLSAMDVFLFPSFFEGLGIVGVEAQAAGLPCVFSNAIPDEACVTDLVTKVSLNEKASDWALQIQKLKLRKERGGYCRVVAQAGFDVKNNLRILEELYNV